MELTLSKKCCLREITKVVFNEQYPTNVIFNDGRHPIKEFKFNDAWAFQEISSLLMGYARYRPPLFSFLCMSKRQRNIVKNENNIYEKELSVALRTLIILTVLSRNMDISDRDMAWFNTQRSSWFTLYYTDRHLK